MTVTTPPAVQRPVFKTQAEAQAELLDYIIKRRSGEITSLKTPWAKFDAMHIDGLEMGRIVTIAGMSGSGKSTIANQLNAELHELNPRENFDILNFNFDMASKEIELRKLIGQMNITNAELLSAQGIQLDDDKMERVELLLNGEHANVGIKYCEYPKTVETYVKIVKTYADRNPGKKLVVITDHSVLFKKAMNEKSATEMLYSLGEGSIELRREVDCVQIHISQLNREIEDTKRKEPKSFFNYPTKGDLFGGDALYQCADTVLVNHRPAVLGFPRDTYGPERWACGASDVYWHFLKLRQSDPGIAHMLGDFAHFKIYDK